MSKMQTGVKRWRDIGEVRITVRKLGDGKPGIVYAVYQPDRTKERQVWMTEAYAMELSAGILDRARAGAL